MSSQTCAVLAQVFPIFLIAVALEGRAVHRKIVRLRFYKRLTVTSLSTGLVGTATTVVGVQLGGFTSGAAAAAWALFAFSALATIIFLIMVAATTELAVEEPGSSPQPTRRQLFADFIRGRQQD